jgi:hypothetical protein
MSIIQNEHGVFVVRKKVPKKLEEATAVVTGACKPRVAFLQRSLRRKTNARRRTRLLDCLIVAPQQDYDEPEILSYAIRPFCRTSADGPALEFGIQAQAARKGTERTI